MARRAAFLLLPTAAVALAQSSSETTGYLGCYTDRHDRIFSGPMTSSADNSPETCKAACEGYAFYGLQYSKQCFCGAADEDFTRHGESQKCLRPCSGDRKSICGGDWAMDVYVMDGYGSSTGTTYSDTSSSSGCSNSSVGFNSCLDPTDSANYKCNPGTSSISFSSCTDLVDADLPDMQECFDTAGRSGITTIILGHNSAITEFPDGMFKDLPALLTLVVSSTKVKALNAGLFYGLGCSSLVQVGIVACPELTELPADLFAVLGNIRFVRIQRNPKLTTLPAGLFEYNNELGQIDLYNNGLTALPLGLFDGLDEVRYLGMTDNPLTALPAGLFEPMTSLAQLRLDRNTDMQCLPDSSASYVKFDAEEGTCGCTPANAVSCPTGTACSPGDSGYTCD